MTTNITKKQIEDKGKEEYTLWRQAKDKVNTLLALSSKAALGYHSVLNEDYIASNMEANNDRLFGALTSDDPADMLDVIGPGGGVAGAVKGTMRMLKNKASAVNRGAFKKNKSKKRVTKRPQGYKHPGVKYATPKEIAEMNRKLRNGLEI